MNPDPFTDCILGKRDPDHNSDIIVERIVLRRVRLPLTVPYRLSYRTFESFEPIIVEAYGMDSGIGWGDGHISPGSSAETREGGWSFIQKMASQIVGLETVEAINNIAKRMHKNKVAGSALIVALEMLEKSPFLDVPEDTRLPLLAPINGLKAKEIEFEIESKLAEGFRTFKIKVGKDADADLARLAIIQKVVNGRATLRIDANRAYDLEQGIKFASSLDPTGVELFEQPCASEDWEGNARVAEKSNVALMLDEPICDMADIEKAATIKGVGFCKLKLKRFGSLACLGLGLERVRDLGMEPVLGDGLGSEITGWMEASVAQTLIRNAGEFNGFLKASDRLFETPLQFENGDLVLPKGFSPRFDRQRLDHLTIDRVELAAA